MSESKIKKCKMPKCDKEVHKRSALFCLEHKRKMNEYSSNTSKVIVAVGGLTVMTVKVVGKGLLKKKF